MTTITYRVGDVLRLHRRLVKVQPLAMYEEIGIRSFGKGIFHKEPVLGAELGTKRIFQVHPGDLVFNNVFAWEGAVGLAGESERGKVGSHRFMTYVADPSKADATYLRYFFISERGLAMLRQASPGSAGRNRTLAIDRFEALHVTLPELDEQLRLAARLDGIAMRTDKLNELVENAERTATALLVSLVASSAPPVEVRELVVQLQRQERVDPANEYTLLGARWYGAGLFVRERRPGHEIAATRLQRVRSGDFVYNRLFAWKGSFALAGNEHDGAYVSNEFPLFQVSEDRVLPEYLLAYFRTPSVWTDAFGKSTGGTPTSRNRLKEDRFLSMKVPLPSMERQREVMRRIHALDHIASKRRAQVPAIKALTQSAINQAFAGEL